MDHVDARLLAGLMAVVDDTEAGSSVPLESWVAGHTVGMELFGGLELGMLEFGRRFVSAGCFCGLILFAGISQSRRYHVNDLQANVITPFKNPQTCGKCCYTTHVCASLLSQ
jgi:hypothetical protein